MRKVIWMDDDAHLKLKVFCAQAGITMKKFVELSLNETNLHAVKILSENEAVK